jgi:hypothetical protein
MKVISGGPAGENSTWELESWLKESYPKLFTSGNFLGQKFFKSKRVVIPRLLELIVYYHIIKYYFISYYFSRI